MFSIDEYMIEHRLSLGKSIQNRKKIYLDTKYWGYLCDVSLGKNTDATLREIHNTLIKLFQEKKIICPLSYRIYSELRKQKDISRLHETAKIMELLSENVMIIYETERIDFELRSFLANIIKKNSEREADIYVWSKASFLMGHVIPEDLPFLSNQENEWIQKEFFKNMWEYSFSELINIMGVETNLELQNMPNNTANTINKDKVNFEHELINPQNVYMSEMAGQLDIYRESIKNTFNKFATEETKSSHELGNNPEDDIQPIINMIYQVFAHEKMGKYLPTFDIGAKIHSTIRWNKTQKYKANDFDDIGHIRTALPYYDYFFTEKSFCTLVKNIKYDEKYLCTVAWEPEEILSMLNQL